MSSSEVKCSIRKCKNAAAPGKTKCFRCLRQNAESMKRRRFHEIHGEVLVPISQTDLDRAKSDEQGMLREAIDALVVPPHKITQ